ncbi:hypothetical protein BD626DRAFT_5635 [Schizophyllum amplum]|uniref:Uncharacterized protein n=1 Tax=Schizophyllum amplum TaxID=97359 RepID=A0A550CWC0_9AGAR|nr:hypothetical protein BD626DRAFT_5635 [Auriculariopsis ampla]
MMSGEYKLAIVDRVHGNRLWDVTPNFRGQQNRQELTQYSSNKTESVTSGQSAPRDALRDRAAHGSEIKQRIEAGWRSPGGEQPQRESMDSERERTEGEREPAGGAASVRARDDTPRRPVSDVGQPSHARRREGVLCSTSGTRPGPVVGWIYGRHSFIRYPRAVHEH